MSTERRFILLTGIPGSGKTFLGNYLKNEHDFDFFETDLNWSEFMRELDLGVDDFVARWHNKHGDCTCLEWGFDPFVPSYLPTILSFKNQGASIFWLTCDKRIALLNYLEKHIGSDPAARGWDMQVNKIEFIGLPTSDFTIIQTYRNGNPIPLEELAQKILGR
jgi:hypothetical protein